MATNSKMADYVHRYDIKYQQGKNKQINNEPNQTQPDQPRPDQTTNHPNERTHKQTDNQASKQASKQPTKPKQTNPNKNLQSSVSLGNIFKKEVRTQRQQKARQSSPTFVVSALLPHHYQMYFASVCQRLSVLTDDCIFMCLVAYYILICRSFYCFFKKRSHSGGGRGRGGGWEGGEEKGEGEDTQSMRISHLLGVVTGKF